ncbi:ankyrin and het domain-containing protein [Colletotrichum karsti]|uniref:Ankyrin and het domain-containing protein n=1 Tax=Colletotrichum karsti TaxID=1095194 RepID=A0A9P6HZ91_9PEZI|nr:ankyrin and het domain-containing protein [Colletotrichum karsti]KAF9873159.1 ankyrin and het domain-containing protein [Colletotrichum karsti]
MLFIDSLSNGPLRHFTLGATLVLAAPLVCYAFVPNACRDLLSRVKRLIRRRPRYVHARLDEGYFRQLHLLPGRDGEEVRVKLTTVSIDDPAPYHAVSYAWGDLRDHAYITCDDGEMQITRTLFEALKRWRRPDEEFVLWADSICIDQQNTQEKTHQIARMTEIYSRAASVLIWLGSDDKDLDGVTELVEEALGFIPEVVDDPKKNRESAELLGQRNTERFDEGKSTTKGMDWKPLRSLLNHSWFERKWVYQEAVLNEKTVLYCGKLEMPFESVAELALRMATFGIQALPNDGSLTDRTVAFIPGRLYNLSLMRLSHWYRGKKPVTLMDGVKATRSFACSDPRDHILGIFGHASDVEKDSIISQDNLYALSVQDCYLRFAKSQLLEKRNLNILSLAPQKLVADAMAPWYLRPYIRWQKRRLPGLPSWVPDLRNQEVDSLPSYSVRYGKFSAGGIALPNVQIIDDKVLRCTGMIIDTVKEDGIFWPELPFPPAPKRVPHPLHLVDSYHSRNAWRSLNYYRQCVKLACGSENINDMSAERLDAFWKTMTCERSQLSDRIDVDMSGHVKTMITGMEVWLTSEDPEEAEMARIRFVVSGQAVEMSILSAATPRRLSSTAEGRLLPLIIRPTTNGLYELVGDAYVSGVMDGEALTSAENDFALSSFWLGTGFLPTEAIFVAEMPTSILRGSAYCPETVRVHAQRNADNSRCDEQRPACKNCIKHGVACGFLSSPSRDPMFSLSQHAGDLNFLDLELLHHYCNFTAYTLSENSLMREFWRMNVIKLGVECDYVMRSVLSLAALHLGHLCPERKDYLLQKSMAHHEMSSRTAVGLMQEVHESNKAQLFIFSVLTIYIVLANSQHLSDAPLAGVEQSPDWIVLFCGTRYLVGEPNDNLLISPIITRTTRHFQTRERPYHHTHLGDLEANINASERDDGLLAIYNHAINELYKSYGVFYECTEPQDITDVFVWIAMVADDFLPLLRESRQKALVIFLYFCMLLKQLPSQWWLDAWSSNLYGKTYGLLDDEHRAWIRDPTMEFSDMCP